MRLLHRPRTRSRHTASCGPETPGYRRLICPTTCRLSVISSSAVNCRCRLLCSDFDKGARLVTVYGTGGIGKTRLALRYARQWLGEYPGGAWFCDLSQATSVDGIAHAIGKALDVPLGKSEPIRQLGLAIAGRKSCLVILDNFEQVASHAESTLGSWLEQAPEARFLVTSRELLGIAGESALDLAPLDPDEGARLFRERIGAIGMDKQLGAADEAAIPRLIEMLDRLPLAIELAAARAPLMSAQQMLQRMGERFKLLTAGRGRRDRQATLRATLDWSWDLLSESEQSGLSQLSVFEGGFTLEAAEAVIALPGSPNLWVGDVVHSLVSKSLRAACTAPPIRNAAKRPGIRERAAGCVQEH